MRPALALLLLITGFLKVGDGGDLAEAVAAYRLLPAVANQLLAICLPWAELLVGGLLLAGIWIAPSALLCSILFGAFTFATGTALLRGMDFECPCFGRGKGLPLEGLLLLDVVAFAAALLVLRGKLLALRSLPAPPDEPGDVRGAKNPGWAVPATFLATLVSTVSAGVVYRLLERSTWTGEPLGPVWLTALSTGALCFACWRGRG